MTTARSAVIRSWLIGACLLTAACSPESAQIGEHIVFAVANGFGQGIHGITTADIVDIGVSRQYNVTDQSVRVSRVSLVAEAPAVSLRGVTAHTDPGVGILTGNLVRLCRDTYPSYPVTDVVVQPHAESNWNLVLAVTFAKPGRYYLGRVKIYYTTGGRSGWQYQNIFTTIYVHAARPGVKPRFDGCP